MNKTGSFRIGDVVRFHYGTSEVLGTVKEDRGPIGLQGRQLYLVEFSPPSVESPYSYLIELPAELLERLPTWVILNLEGTAPVIEQHHNVSGVTDNGGHREFDLTLIFAEPMNDDLFACEVLGNREVSHEILGRTRGSVRLIIHAPFPERVKIVCYHR